MWRELIFLAAIWGCSSSSFAASEFLDRPMDETTAASMLGRFGFGPTATSIAKFVSVTPRRYMEQGLLSNSDFPAPIRARIGALPTSEPVEETWAAYGPGGSKQSSRDDTEAKQDMQRIERRYAKAAVEARLLAMANSDNPAHEAMLAFWLNHFSVYAPKNFVKLLASDYAAHIEDAMKQDSFEALLRASFYHPAMQFYLDNVQSTAVDSRMAAMAERRGKTLGINENLARELMELHTLGVGGGYTQNDVQELARIITGAGAWIPRMNPQALQRAGAVRKDLFLFDPRRHDFGAKTLLGQSFPAGHGMDELDRALHLLATSPATARHISLKLALRFMSDTPSDATIDKMTDAFLRSGGKISATLYAMMGSDEFAHSLQDHDKFKEPLDQLLSDARAACQEQPIGNGVLLTAAAVDAGEAPFMKTTPDGYGMRESDWLSPAAMAKRIRFAMGIAADRVPLAQGNGDDDDKPSLKQGAMDKMDKPAFLQGVLCATNAAAIETGLAPLSATTRKSLQGLGPREQVAVLLASPEAMRR